MQITRSSIDTHTGPADWFTGGLCQQEGSPVEVIRPGDRVVFEPGENHWPGAGPDRFMVHLAMQQNDEVGRPVTWRRHVSDEECAEAPASSD